MNDFAAPPTRKSRRLYRVLSVMALLTIVAILASPWIVSKTGLRDRLINGILNSPNVTATTRSASFGWLSPLSVQGLELSSEGRRVRIQVDKFTAERPWWRLRSSLPELGTVTLEKPHVRIELPFEKFEPEPKRSLPIFTGLVRNGGLTVCAGNSKEPVVDLEGVDMTVRVEDENGGRVLVVDRANVLQNEKLSPKMCDKLLRLLAPTFGDSPNVSGEITLALDKFRVPLGTPKDRIARSVEMEGTLTLHRVTTESTGPLMRAVVKIVADMYGKPATEIVRAAKDAEVKFRVANGRLHHEGMKIGFPDLSPHLLVTSRGSVGIDETLDMHLEVPRLNAQAQREKGPVRCHITGTIRNPVVAVQDASLLVHLPGRKTPFVVVDGLDLNMHVESGTHGPVLAIDPFKVYDRRKLSPTTTDQLLQLVDPTLGELADLSGDISLAVSKARIPLSASADLIAADAEVEGVVVFHRVTSSVSHPLRKLLSKLLADLHGKEPPAVVRMVKNAEVKFRVKDGRLHHEGLTLGFPDVHPDLQMRMQGSVGLDRTLDLHLEIPRQDTEKRKEKGPIPCHVTGTVRDPKIAVRDASLVVRIPDRIKPLVAIDGVDMTMHLDRSEGRNALSIDPVTVFEKQKFRPEFVGDLVHLLVPGIRDVPDVSGEITFAIDKLKVPLDGTKEELIKNLAVEGRLNLHRITTMAAGPLQQLMVRALADHYGKKPSDVVRLAKNAEVKFRVVDGRLHYDGLKIGFPDISPDLQVNLRGSVGFDESLDLKLEIPRLDKLKQNEKGPVQCRITGTIGNPEMAIRDASLVVRLDDRPKPLLDIDGVDLALKVEPSKDGPRLCLAPVTVVKRQKITPELAGELMDLILPTLGDCAKVRGEFSLALDSFRVPVGVSGPDLFKKVELAGKAELHQVFVSVETPIMQAMVKVLADLHGKKPSAVVRVTKNTEIRFQVRDGRMYHEGLKLGFPDISPDLTATSRGSVGLDRSLDLYLEVARILANGRIDPAAEKLGPVRFHVTGTFEKPVVTEIADRKNK